MTELTHAQRVIIEREREYHQIMVNAGLRSKDSTPEEHRRRGVAGMLAPAGDSPSPTPPPPTTPGAADV